MPARTRGLFAGLLCLLASARAEAFPHVVQRGETAAQIAERMYGRIELERVVVAANELDGRRGSALVPGMRLEIPAVGHRKVLAGDTWHGIAAELLGEHSRGDVLAFVNGGKPWLKPAVGSELVIPYNLRFVASRGDTTESVAYRFLGRRDHAWVIASYNGLKRAILRQGEVLLVPLTDLGLTADGKKSALLAGALIKSEGGGAAREAQKRAETELPLLAQEVRRGRYVEAIARGAALVGVGEGASLSKPQLAAAYRYLTEAYVAMEASAAASEACKLWREHDPAAVLDPIETSPKILAVCVGEEARPDVDDAESAASAASAAPSAAQEEDP